jgi:hypothetical protein
MNNFPNIVNLFFRVEVSKLLGKVEMLTVPYVTEYTRVHILLPVHTSEKEDAFRFLKQFKQICIDKKEKTMLMLVSIIISQLLDNIKVKICMFRFYCMMLMHQVKVQLMMYLNN